MGRLIKWLFYLLILAAILLVLYAYAGPFLGVDFSAIQNERSTPITINTE